MNREGFGEVELNRYGVDGIINHKPNRSKVLGIAAIKEVIEKGHIIKSNLNWKGRGYDSYMIAAPVEIGDTTVYVAAVVSRDQGTNKFYLDEVVDQNGNYISIKNEAPGNTKTGVTVQDGVTRGPRASSNGIIRQAEGDSQGKSSGRASVEVESRTADNETGYSDNKKPSFDSETARAFVKFYSALQRVVDERTAAYQEATKANDPNYDYETESKWLSKASQELARSKAQYEEALNVYKEQKAGKRKRNVRNTRNDLLRVFSTDRASRAAAEQFMNQKIGEMMMQGEVSETALNEITDWMLETVSVTSSSKNNPWIPEHYGHRTC